MDLEEMKSIWDDMPQKPKENEIILRQNTSDMVQTALNKQANSFKIGEFTGSLVAYTLAGIILYNFSILDTWYLSSSGILVVLYLIAMPLYTLAGIKKMKEIDLAKSNYKEVMEHFYAVKSRLKQAERISFIASPFLFSAAVVIFTKVVAGVDFFTLALKIPVVLLIVLSFSGATLFNIWVFKKRGQQLQSVQELLEEKD